MCFVRGQCTIALPYRLLSQRALAGSVYSNHDGGQRLARKVVIKMKLTPLEAVNEIRSKNNGQVVLVLQGGGALGAYQGGVYQALHEAGVEPDWIIGTSIGAINAALITGNKPEGRLPKLKEFWKRVERANFWGAFPALAGAGDALASWMTLTKGISGVF